MGIPSSMHHMPRRREIDVEAAAIGDSLDWKDPPPEKIVSRVLERVQNGSIILFHNAAKNTPAALPQVIEGLIAKGYSFVPVSQLIYRENYTVDSTGRQIPN